MKLVSGPTGRIKVSGKGAHLDVGGLLYATPVLARVLGETYGRCFGAYFLTPTRNTASEFRGRFP